VKKALSGQKPGIIAGRKSDTEIAIADE